MANSSSAHEYTGVLGRQTGLCIEPSQIGTGANTTDHGVELGDYAMSVSPVHGSRPTEFRFDLRPDSDHGRRCDALLAAVPRLKLGGLDIAVTGRADAAELIIDLAVARRGTDTPPAIITSANGQVLSQCARDRRIRDLFHDSDLIHADGMPLVFASYLHRGQRIPERVATTDLFHDVAGRASRQGVSFYLVGSTPEGMDRAAANIRRMYPKLDLIGAHHGYLQDSAVEDQVRRIAELRPDVLWIGMGSPLEQRFAHRWRSALSGVGVIKTAGGLFDFLSGAQRRAPMWMQQAGLEWLYRTCREPYRLMARYALTNPHAMYLLLKRWD